MSVGRVAGIAAVSLIAIMGFAGWAAFGTSAKSTTITFVAPEYSEKTQGYWERLIRMFEAKNPDVKVKLVMVNWNDITQKVNTLVATKQQPDLLNLNTFSGFARAGLLYKASEALPASVNADFIETFAKNARYKGRQYGLPLIASARAFFYNKNIFKLAGIASPPRTWDQLRADAQKIAALPGGYIGYGMPLGPEEAQAEWSLWMWGNGGDWKTNGRWSIDSPQNVRTLSFMNDLVNKYKVTQVNPGQTNRTDGVWALFAQGKVGMAMGSPGTFIGMLAKNPSVRYGISAVPVNGSRPPVTLGVEDYLMAFKKKGNQNAVRKFLSFYYQKANYAKFITTEGFLPTTKSGSNAVRSNPKFAPYLKLLAGARFYPSDDPEWPKIQGSVQTLIGTGVQGKSPKDVLERLQKTAEQSG